MGPIVLSFSRLLGLLIQLEVTVTIALLVFKLLLRPEPAHWEDGAKRNALQREKLQLLGGYDMEVRAIWICYNRAIGAMMATGLFHVRLGYNGY